ncbi:Dimethyl sulfoxide/trimethylamine N-oxide reductase precursor [Pantoea agglomerans]|uniref:Dimethyl sulfoxide/trimethylamine N-oxide reductase n=1 Tax=Enterobacter agglomerans TaxID=549 RepID=A0A379LR47_ENTAG|nr:Dimethyl sulfoxide/trimethylamine N-oxide reductase precursor [Pantoea agglomerans]
MDEAPGFACWYAPEYQAQQQEKQQWPLHLLSSQPRTRLHSQYDHGRVSRATKIAGREPLWMHPEDAAARGIEENSIVKVFNGRGALLAGVHLTQDILPGVVQMSTGAWYDPLDQQEGQPLDKHGNPNVLTQDSGSFTTRPGVQCADLFCRDCALSTAFA